MNNDQTLHGYIFLCHMNTPLEKTWTFKSAEALTAHLMNNTGYTYHVTSYCVEGWRPSEYAATAADWLMKLMQSNA